MSLGRSLAIFQSLIPWRSAIFFHLLENYLPPLAFTSFRFSSRITRSFEMCSTQQVVAIPYPGRGHVNPLMNLCKLILRKRPNIHITFIVTEEWYGFIRTEPKPDNIRYGRIPNVVPSEIGRGKDFPGFVAAVLTNMEGAVQTLLEQLEPLTPSVIIFDSYLPWVVGLAKRMSIPAASFWPMSATMFSILRQYEVLVQNGHFPPQQLESEEGEKKVNYIPGVPSLRVADLPRDIFGVRRRETLKKAMDGILLASKTQHLLFSSVYELESEVIDSLKKELPLPIYCIGPAIPYFSGEESGSQTAIGHHQVNYMAWLDAQPEDSVLYISQGSFLSASSEQLDEVIAGVYDSGIKFLWISREDISKLQYGCSDKGLVVPWCHQLKVLIHPSIGGFWTHCGWNSTKEGVYAGVPMLTFPISWDQFSNSKKIAEDWKIGWRVGRDDQSLVTREEVSRLLKRFMDLESVEGKQMRRRARELRDICRRQTISAELQIDSFLNNILC